VTASLDLAARQRLVMRPTLSPISEPVTKLGGFPTWTDTPTWPLSASVGGPMPFIGQVQLPAIGEAPARLTHLFLAEDDEEDIEDTWEPDAGENALVCQPGRLAPFLTTEQLAEGPVYGSDVAVTLVPVADDERPSSFVGGTPVWLQADETPAGFTFVFQLDSTELPFSVNFGGDGIGYAFVDLATGEGRFLWQCT
jgi:hypothetical protein